MTFFCRVLDSGTWHVFAFLMRCVGKKPLTLMKGFMRISWKFELNYMCFGFIYLVKQSMMDQLKFELNLVLLWQVEEIGSSCVCSLSWETRFEQCTSSCDVACFSSGTVGEAFFYETSVDGFCRSGVLDSWCGSDSYFSRCPWKFGAYETAWLALFLLQSVPWQ